MQNLIKKIDNAMAAIDNCLELCEELKKTLAEYTGTEPADEDMVREGLPTNEEI